MKIAIRRGDGTIDDNTVSYDEEEAWNKYLGFRAQDDQWSWQRQLAEQGGARSVYVELKEVGLTEHSKNTEEYYKEYPPEVKKRR